MDRICSFIKSQWKNVLIVILFVSLIFKVFPLSIITFCDKHEGLISSVIGFITLIVAVLALFTWKNEFKAKKKYKLYNQAYYFLFEFNWFLKILHSNYNDMTEHKDELEIENFINDKCCKYFKNNLKEAQYLLLNLKQINENFIIFQKIETLMRTYIYKYTDRPCHDMPIDINGNEITPYINSFYKEYLMNEDTNEVSRLTIFRNDIENNMKNFEKEIQKFFK